MNRESFYEEKNRIVSFLNEIKKTSYKKVLITTHEKPMKIFYGIFNILTNNQIDKLHFDNCEIIQLELYTPRNFTVPERKTISNYIF